VIGINPRHTLADNTVTTQPEYSFHFDDVQWGVENYGTDPDIDVDIAPQDFARGVDRSWTGRSRWCWSRSSSSRRTPRWPPRAVLAAPKLPRDRS